MQSIIASSSSLSLRRCLASRDSRVWRATTACLRNRSTCNSLLASHSPPTTTSALIRSRRRPTIANDYHSTTRVSLAEEVAASEEASPEEEKEPHPTDFKYAFTAPPPLSEESQKKVDDLFEKILWLDMIELHLLTQVVNENLGMDWVESDGGGMPAAGSGGAAAAEEEDESSALKEVKLVGFDAKAKIKVIKEVRAIAGLGLKEAKELVDSAPKVIQKDLKPEKAEELKAQLEAVGAQIEIV